MTNGPPASSERPVKGKPCPICGRPAHTDTAPFCSRRCADVDLNRWLGGVYAVPVSSAEEDDDQERPAEDPLA